MSTTIASLDVGSAATELDGIFDDELDTAALAERRGQKIYRSLQKLSQLIGGEYGDRVLYELIQNAHDAQPAGEPGDVAIRLVVEAEDEGVLYVANGGSGFSLANVQAIRNIANSTKEVGEGIGNKGVGFRSVEALTDDVRIYSRRGATTVSRFDGYCFRFAVPEEIECRAVELGFAQEAKAVAAAMPRYLAAIPSQDQPEPILEFARRGFATVVVLPLRSSHAVKLAIAQAEELVRSEAPVLLFLERIRKLDIDIEGAGVTRRRPHTLTRHVSEIEETVAGVENCRIQAVTLGPSRKRWLLVRRILNHDRVVDAVKRSRPQERGLRSWEDWKGDATVSLAVPMEGAGLKVGRLYNFLPMGPESPAPLLAHLDAPFFTAIDRRRAKLDLPLNEELLNGAAEASAAAAVTLTARHPDTLPRIIVDLAAWSPASFGRLQNAYAAVGVTWADAAVWPTIDRSWVSIRSLRIWPDGKFKIFTPLRAAAKATVLLPSLDPQRAGAIQSLAKVAYISIEPTAKDLANWAEAIAARLSTKPEAVRRLWGPFYSDTVSAFGSADRLRALAGHKILLDRAGELLAAGGDIYVRPEGGRRAKVEGAPLPPKQVARKLAILSDDVPIRSETFTAFERAGLWKRYDATAILARLPSLFGDRPAPARREAALTWAFDVWRHDMAAARRVLRQAKLQVPTRGGWTGAASAAFSESWTAMGKHVETYLAEASGLAPDCERATSRLLISWDQWPGRGIGSKTEWLRFLSDADVVDGLVPTASTLPRGPNRGDTWSYHFSSASDVGLDAVWRKNNNFGGVAHPYTDYSRQAEAWRLPGQTIVERLSDDGRKRFALVVLKHLEQFGSDHLWFKLGRFDREEKLHDARLLRTPLHTFLITAVWLPITTRGEDSFAKVSDAWLLTDRRTDPKFVPRVPEDIADYLTLDGKAFEILSTPALGLKVWKDPSTAASKLFVLANLCEDLEQRDRAPFKKQYDQAWRELVESGKSCGPRLPLAIEKPAGFGTISGSQPAPHIYVRTERDRDMTKLLIDTGASVLVGNGEADADAIVSLLKITGNFDARLVDQGDVQLLVDGVPFQTSLEDPLLVDQVPWLAEALVLGHEINARELEKVISSASLEDRLRRVRLRRGESIELSRPEAPTKLLQRYLYRDDDRPTLILAGDLDAQQLANNATQLSALLHPNLRSFEPLLLRLAPRLPQDQPLSEIEHPTEDDYAFAIQVEVDVIRENLIFSQKDSARLLPLITPVVAYFAGRVAALELQTVLADEPHARWPTLLSQSIPSDLVQPLLDVIEVSEDLAAVRRTLQLDYARFNQTLRSLGRPALSSATELKRLFEVWKSDLAPTLHERLRRHFVSKVSEPAALQRYAALRGLDFITFDERWVDTHETLERDDVRQRSHRIFEDTFGLDPGGELPAREALRTSNRKALTAFAQSALPILRAVRGEALPAAWVTGPVEVAAAADRAGALDFEHLANNQMIMTLVIAGLWPDGLPQSLNLRELGLTQADLDAEANREARERVDEARRRNTIEFGGTPYDTSSDEFTTSFAGIADTLFAQSDWRTRTRLRQSVLREMPEGERDRRGGGGGPSRPAPRPPEAVRGAMGLTGEILAFHYLSAKHRERFTEGCWVSENRASLFPEPGSISHGFDFRVRTTETEWLYEVKATPYDACEFELTDNEYRTATLAASEKSQRYRILMVQYVFDLGRCRVLELPNPAGMGRGGFRIIGRSSVRMKFELA